ncbi:MAG: D-isomer specific 2-hydroxyacid dehydrogenase family protein [Lachnospiraceae bacterium]|jgi:lactate dehydrogenase-like 2-hydroxyacid dehydrogenase
MKIFFYYLREFDELGYCREFREKTGIDFGYTTQYPSMENADLAAGADAISFTPCAMPEELMKKFADLGVRYFLCRSIGYDHVDLKTAARLGLRVSNVSYSPDGVADYAIMLMLMCLRRMGHILKRVELQDYTLKGKIGRDITRCTVGVIGTGRIGTTVLKHLSGFGCRLIANDLYPNSEAARYAEYVDLDTLWREADVISLHANATEQNYHLIGEESLAKMKDGVVIVNTSRGKLIDDKALIRAIEAGKVGAAGLDVVENEAGLYYYNHIGDVMKRDDLAILRSFPNVIISPHTAFYTEQDVSQMVEGCFTSLQLFAEGKENPREVKAAK